ncbi:MAG: nitrogen fixation protein NifH [Anaerolineae bacterium]|nr:nitrogen fixation protein NifH [Anaerolineae bacterium]
MSGRDRLGADPLSWLLEPDADNPGVRYFALRDLSGCPADAAELRQARASVMSTGPVPAILDAQYPQGYWVKPGSGYSPKYRSTVWQIIFLAELGADPADGRVRAGCDYLLAHSMAANGAFSCYAKPTPSGSFTCLNGNLLHALLRLGYGDDPRVQAALDWLARAITGGIDYLESGTCGPDFACRANDGLPCGWGAVKGMRALLAVPPGQRSTSITAAMERGAAFLLSRDPAAADYPYSQRVSSTWFKLGFPLTYWSDVLELVAVLVDLGFGGDPRLVGAVQWVMERRDEQGRWKLENGINGKMWADVERKNRPSKWVTLRALRMLKGLE